MERLAGAGSTPGARMAWHPPRAGRLSGLAARIGASRVDAARRPLEGNRWRPVCIWHMALRDPVERLEPRPRPDWRSAPIKVQFGGMAEDLLAVSLEAAGGGSAPDAPARSQPRGRP